MTDHYELQCAQWAKRISGLSLESLQRKLPELHKQGTNLTLWHFDRQISIDMRSGLLHCVNDSEPLCLSEKLNVYTLLWYCKENARLSGSWVPFHSIKDASPFAPAFEKSVLRNFSRMFDGKTSQLKEAVSQLKGSQINNNSYFVPAFACIPLRLQFWDGDDEFPAQGNILFDRSATDFIHVESLVTIASQCLRRLMIAGNLKENRNDNK